MIDLRSFIMKQPVAASYNKCKLHKIQAMNLLTLKLQGCVYVNTLPASSFGLLDKGQIQKRFLFPGKKINQCLRPLGHKKLPTVRVPVLRLIRLWSKKQIMLHTVELGFKNRQNKNLLDFKNQITNYQLVIYVVNYSQDKNNLDFKNQNSSDRKSS